MSSNPSSSSTGWSKNTSPYHRGEQMVQEKAGAREFAERIGRQVIRDFMTQQHRDFYAMLPFIFAGSLDAARRPWASILWGPPGFTSSPDPRRLQVRALPAAGDPLSENLRTGAPVALVGVQFETRRRNRLTGWVEHADDNGFDLAVGQSFGNCPLYIQAREPHFVGDPQAVASPQGSPAPEGALLSGRAQELIRRSDTFFIASASPHAGASDPVEGADVNHRGGRQGFVRVTTAQGRSVITWPDFVGNSAFNTLGNIALNPVAGLLFVDFESGDVLSFTGQAVVLWDDDRMQELRGAERLVQLTVDEGVYIAGALPLRWGPPEYATQLIRTGVWSEALHARQSQTPATQYRPFVIERMEDESATVRSFFLAPADGLALPPHLPGQFLPIAISIGSDSVDLRRTYTISNQPEGRTYRLSIKREARLGGELGLVSSWFHDTARVGTRVHAMAPRGDFLLDTQSRRPVVMLSAGIGITPLIAMVDYLMSANLERPRFPDRRAFFLHFSRSGADFAFGKHLRALKARRLNLLTHVRFSDPRDLDIAGVDYDSSGLIDEQLISGMLALDDYDFYLCGPQPFMQQAYDILLNLGIRDGRIRSESFGPASITRSPQQGPAAAPLTTAVESAVVRFQKSGKQQGWTPASGFLLDSAEAAGLDLPWSCRSGSCGTCRVPIVAGEVTYSSLPAAPVDARSALLCCALPSTAELVVDA